MGIYWRFDYQFAGKRKTLPIGTFPLITITEARKTHREAKVGHTKQFYPNEYSPNVYNRMVGELADKAVNHPCDFDELPAYRITDSDWQRINLFRNELEPHIREGSKYSTATMRGNVSKVDIHIMKIAALLAYLYDSPLGAIPSQFVDAGMGIMREMLDYTNPSPDSTGKSEGEAI